MWVPNLIVSNVSRRAISSCSANSIAGMTQQGEADVEARVAPLLCRISLPTPTPCMPSSPTCRRWRKWQRRPRRWSGCKGRRRPPRREVQRHQQPRHQVVVHHLHVTDAEPGRVFAFNVAAPWCPSRIGVMTSRRQMMGPAVSPSGPGIAAPSLPTAPYSPPRRCPAGSAVPAGWATGVKDRKAANAEHIAHTLQRLKAKAEAAR